MINVIADRYAQALFEVGEETQTTSELYQELSELVDIFNENKDLYNFLKSPLIGREDKKNVMQNIFKNQLSNSMNNFLKLVIDKDRISAIENMKESYKSLLNDKNNILEGTAFASGMGIASPAFSMQKLDDRMRFLSKGKGHGLGFSQYGGDALAKEGKTWQEILHIYFPLMEIETEDFDYI